MRSKRATNALSRTAWASMVPLDNAVAARALSHSIARSIRWPSEASVRRASANRGPPRCSVASVRCVEPLERSNQHRLGVALHDLLGGADRVDKKLGGRSGRLERSMGDLVGDRTVGLVTDSGNDR